MIDSVVFVSFIRTSFVCSFFVIKIQPVQPVVTGLAAWCRSSITNVYVYSGKQRQHLQFVRCAFVLSHVSLQMTAKMQVTVVKQLYEWSYYPCEHHESNVSILLDQINHTVDKCTRDEHLSWLYLSLYFFHDFVRTKWFNLCKRSSSLAAL